MKRLTKIPLASRVLVGISFVLVAVELVLFATGPITWINILVLVVFLVVMVANYVVIFMASRGAAKRDIEAAQPEA